jgi:hypothetical protein
VNLAIDEERNDLVVVRIRLAHGFSEGEHRW